ncbi:MAG: zinc ribbon domain-containing protein [Blautia massiliensis (ex Durand et al. 2017)]
MDASYIPIAEARGFTTHWIKNLGIRIWECSKCHAVHDRDTNASINILKKGLQMQSA